MPNRTSMTRELMRGQGPTVMKRRHTDIAKDRARVAKSAEYEVSISISRFAVFNPDERKILHTLLQDHANSVSVISTTEDANGAYTPLLEYLGAIEALESECARA